MTKIPPEILAIALPKPYYWNILQGAPRAWADASHLKSGWVDYYEEDRGYNGVHLPDQSYVDYPGATLLELCQALANHMWLMERT